MKRLLILVVLTVAALVPALPAQASNSTASAKAAATAPAAAARTFDYYACQHYCDFVPFGVENCGIDHEGAWADTPAPLRPVYNHDTYHCERFWVVPGQISFHWVGKETHNA